MLLGVDTHVGYGRVDFAKAKAAGVRFAWLKCTQGNENFVDSQFENSLAGCIANGIPAGSYHFLETLNEDEIHHPGRSPEDQARRAFAGDRGLGSKPGQLAHMVDMEWPKTKDAQLVWNISRQQISDRSKRYCEAASDLRERKVVIYTYPDWWRWLEQGADVSWASGYQVVWADYGWLGDGPPPDGWVPPHWGWQKTWSDWAACQFSAEGSKARIDGINACPIDRDCIRSETMLLRLRGLWTPGDPGFPVVHPYPEFGL